MNLVSKAMKKFCKEIEPRKKKSWEGQLLTFSSGIQPETTPWLQEPMSSNNLYFNPVPLTAAHGIPVQPEQGSINGQNYEYATYTPEENRQIEARLNIQRATEAYRLARRIHEEDVHQSSLAGRVQVAQELLDAGLISNDQMLTVLNSGDE